MSSRRWDSTGEDVFQVDTASSELCFMSQVDYCLLAIKSSLKKSVAFLSLTFRPIQGMLISKMGKIKDICIDELNCSIASGNRAEVSSALPIEAVRGSDVRPDYARPEYRLLSDQTEDEDWYAPRPNQVEAFPDDCGPEFECSAAIFPDSCATVVRRVLSVATPIETRPLAC